MEFSSYANLAKVYAKEKHIYVNLQTFCIKLPFVNIFLLLSSQEYIKCYYFMIGVS